MGNLALGFDFGPPSAAMAQTDAILAQRFGDDHMLHAGRIEPAFLRQMGDTTVAAGFLIRCATDFDGTGKVGMFLNERLGGDDRGSQAPLHIAGPAPIDAVAVQRGGKGIIGPACANLDHIGMAVEMHTRAGLGALVPRDDVPAGVFFAISGRTFGTDQGGFKPLGGQPLFQQIADRRIVFARRVQSGNADQILRQRDQIIAHPLNSVLQGVGHQTLRYLAVILVGKPPVGKALGLRDRGNLTDWQGPERHNAFVQAQFDVQLVAVALKRGDKRQHVIQEPHAIAAKPPFVLRLFQQCAPVFGFKRQIAGQAATFVHVELTVQRDACVAKPVFGGLQVDLLDRGAVLAR